jgi:hypothetical protein
MGGGGQIKFTGTFGKRLENFFLASFFVFCGSERREDFCGQRMMRGGCEVLGSVFHVLRLHVLPHPYFYNYIFYCASFWARNGCNGSK